MNAKALSYWPADDSMPVLDLTAGGLLAAAAADSPDQLALVEVVPEGLGSLTGADRTDRTWTYAELYDDARRCAGWLGSTFQPGDRIVVWAPNAPEWIILQYGAALAGLVLVTANPSFRADELRYVIDRSQASALFYVSSFRGSDMELIAKTAAADSDADPALFDMGDWGTRVRTWDIPEQLPEVSPMDPAQIQYTSGTTGFPKGALLHHQGMVTNALYISTRGGWPRHGRLTTAMPLFHTGGCGMAVLGCAHQRITLQLLQMFEPATMLRALSNRSQVVTGVPTMFIAMLNLPEFADHDLSEAQFAMSGGSDVPPELIRQVEQAYGVRLSTVYGQTELSPVVTQTDPLDDDDRRLTTTGKPLWNVEVQIIDPQSGERVAVGEQGEVCARGHQAMLEYFGDPEATASTIDADGWLHTGDLGVFDNDFYLRIVGRLKDMIIRGGENIYPQELEQRIFEHPAVVECAVVGLPDQKWGETVAAVLRLQPDTPITRTELVSYCRERMAPHKTPSDWYVADEFPLTGSGKLQKFKITEAIDAGEYKRLE